MNLQQWNLLIALAALLISLGTVGFVTIFVLSMGRAAKHGDEIIRGRR